MVFVKLAVVLFVIFAGIPHVNTANWKPFMPFGWTGVAAGAATIFFAYIGFDSISTHAEEAKNPKRDVPIAILTSLFLCTVLYIAVAAVLTGMVPYDKIDINAPVAAAFEVFGLNIAVALISAGALAGITSVLLVMMLSQPRVLMAMARDGMVPQSFFSAVHERFRTPWKSKILTGHFVAIVACSSSRSW
jgi:APA family basic amino acid/polyamine antiporter